MQLTNGQRLGHYEIVVALGKGGMGEVYRARDTRLNRDVALKLLPDSVSADADRVARFKREAQLLASLNHPNIAHVYGVEESGDTNVLVMELVDGMDLRHRIARGRLTTKEAVAIAIDVAAALDAAHERGIIHRDLKPANIMLDTEGRAKVLDFGLAKSSGADSEVADANSPTLTSPVNLTQGGVILGTAAYMSPEQATGRAADKRSDIWSFGCVLYELLIGKRPFEAGDVHTTLAAILATEPDWAALDCAPASLKRIVRRCLEKDRRRRYADLSDVRIDLEDSLTPSGVFDEPARARGPSKLAVAAIVASLLAIVAAGLAGWTLAARPVTLPALKLEVDLGMPVSLVTVQGPGAVLSPDGSLMVFVGQPRALGGGQQLYLRRLDALSATALPGTEGAMSPFFSTDSQWVGFFAGAKLKRVAVGGGAAVDVADAPNGRGGSWGDDGHIVYMPDFFSGLWRVPATGGQPVKLTSPAQESGTHRWPHVLPGSKAVIYTSNTTLLGYDDADLVLQPIPTGEARVIQKAAYFGRVLPSGHFVYMQRGTMFAAPFDIGGLRITGDAVPVHEDIANSAFWTGAAQFSVSDTGMLAYVSVESSASPVSWVSASQQISALRPTAAMWSDPTFSRDGSRLAMTLHDSRRSDIWLYDWSRDALSRLTLHPYSSFKPVWTADGRRVAFSMPRSGDAAVFNISWQRSDGSGELQRLTQGVNGQIASSFDPTGRHLALIELDPKTSFDIKVMPISGDEVSGWKPAAALDFVKTPAVELEPMFSPDGRWIAYASNESGRFEVYVRAFPGSGGVWQISRSGGSYPTWSRTGQRLLYATLDQRLMSVDYETDGRSFKASTPRFWTEKRHQLLGPVVNRNYDLHPDGQRIAMSVAPDEHAAGDRVVVITGFLDDLKRRAR